METKHPVEGSFGSQFSSICNHCEVVAARSCKTWKKVPTFCIYWKNDPLWANCQNSVPKGFTASPIAMLRANLVTFGRREIGKVVCCLPLRKKFCLALPLLLLHRSHPKIWQGQYHAIYSECSRFHPIGSLSAELYPKASTLPERA